VALSSLLIALYTVNPVFPIPNPRNLESWEFAFLSVLREFRKESGDFNFLIGKSDICRKFMRSAFEFADAGKFALKGE
jgi:hypothetical protein